MAPSCALAHVIEPVTLKVRLDHRTPGKRAAVIRNGSHVRLFLVATCALLGLAAASAYALARQPGAGESIYLRGVLPSGALLEGKRQAAGLSARGADAACVSCHQRSGLGTYDGYNFDVTIPPIAGAYLFHSREATTKEAVLPYVA